MRRIGKGFSGVDTPLFEGMLVPWQVADDVVANDIADVATDDGADVATNDVFDVVAEDIVEPTPPSPTPSITPPPSQELHSTSQVAPTPPPSPIAQPSSPPQQQQPSQTTKISMDLLHTLLETCTILTRKVEALEKDKIAQALEITKLKQRVRKLEKKRKLKVYGLRRLKKVRTAQKDVTLEEVAVVAKDAEVAEKDDDEAEPVELKEVIEGVVIRDPEETATPSTIVHSDLKSKDKGKGILVEEPKPLKKQEQIKQDKAYTRELEAELNKNINWDDVIEKNMMVYLKNMAGFKMDFFKGMSYDDIRPIFKKHFNTIVGFLEKGEEQLEEEASKALKRKNDVYTEATPLALKVPVVDYQIHTENNKPHQLFLCFLSLLRNFDREDLEMLCFGVDVVEDFKEFTLRDYYCWLNTYCCWYKLKLLDNATDSRLRLLEQSVVADDKMKK
nr:hypothetical protein [Tanacetum cinerariifolium]